MKATKLIMMFVAAAAMMFASCDKEDTEPIDTTTNNSGSGNGGGNNQGGGSDTSTFAGFDENGASIATFSVGNGSQIRFSRGNLQYKASTNTWRFAEHQWDIIGNGNNNISSTYNGWIDLFGWGTSGWESGATAYQPYSNSQNAGEYWPGNECNNELTGDYSRADWGVYNAISNGGNQAGMWRTLTADEWVYLLNTRSASTLGNVPNARWAKAQIGDVSGVVIFPDSFTLPAGIDVPNNINEPEGWFPANLYNLEQWTAMEAAGAVFLPLGGTRYGSEANDAGLFYWTSSLSCSSFEDYYYDMNQHALMIIFTSDNAAIPGYYDRYIGCSVRLVKAE